MNQEYLWSKRGSDAEVERLERLLTEFRFEANSVPELPETNIVPVANTLRRRFVFALSFAASAAAVILVAIWITMTPVVPVAVERHMESVSEAVESTKGDKFGDLLAEETMDVAPTVMRTYVSKAHVNPHHSKVRRSPKVTKVAKEKLTSEEKYAYDRLMLALSITGSKLKVVQDTIDRKGEGAPQSIRNEK